MTKKFLHIAISIILMLATSGVGISKHYCHGSLISFSLTGEAKSCCDSSCNACHTETSFIKVTDNFVVSTISIEEVKTIKINTSHSLFCLVQGYISPDFSLIQNIFLKAPPPNVGYSALPEFLGVFRC